MKCQRARLKSIVHVQNNLAWNRFVCNRNFGLMFGTRFDMVSIGSRVHPCAARIKVTCLFVCRRKAVCFRRSLIRKKTLLPQQIAGKTKRTRSTRYYEWYTCNCSLVIISGSTAHIALSIDRKQATSHFDPDRHRQRQQHQRWRTTY